MAALVSLEFAKEALRVEHDDDDGLIQGYIDAVNEAVLRYLRVLNAANPWTEQNAPKGVKQAIIIGVASLYDPDVPELLSGLGSSDPKNPMVGLLCMLRRPTRA